MIASHGAGVRSAPLVGVLLVTLTLAGCTTPSPDGTGITVGKRAPPFSAVDVDGNAIAIEALAGKVVLLDLMGVNCPPCREEMPHLQEAANRFGGGGLDTDVVFVSVDVGTVFPQLGARSEAEVAAFRDEFNATWHFVKDSPERGIGSAYKPIGIPAAVILDGNGTITFRRDGSIIDANVLAEAIEKARA